jgi:hypothetical protein
MPWHIFCVSYDHQMKIILTIKERKNEEACHHPVFSLPDPVPANE